MRTQSHQVSGPETRSQEEDDYGSDDREDHAGSARRSAIRQGKRMTRFDEDSIKSHGSQYRIRGD